MPGVPQRQLSQLGKHKLVSELHSWHGNYQKPDVLDFFFVQARKEILDLESDICRRTDVSFHVVPYKLKVGDDTCRRILFKPTVTPSLTRRVCTCAPSFPGRQPSSARGRSLIPSSASFPPGAVLSHSRT